MDGWMAWISSWRRLELLGLSSLDDDDKDDEEEGESRQGRGGFMFGINRARHT